MLCNHEALNNSIELLLLVVKNGNVTNANRGSLGQESGCPMLGVETANRTVGSLWVARVTVLSQIGLV